MPAEFEFAVMAAAAAAAVVELGALTLMEPSSGRSPKARLRRPTAKPALPDEIAPLRIGNEDGVDGVANAAAAGSAMAVCVGPTAAAAAELASEPDANDPDRLRCRTIMPPDGSVFVVPFESPALSTNVFVCTFVSAFWSMRSDSYLCSAGVGSTTDEATPTGDRHDEGTNEEEREEAEEDEGEVDDRNEADMGRVERLMRPAAAEKAR